MARPAGSKNKLTGAHGDLLFAWDKVAGPETAKEIMKAAIEKAKKGDFEALKVVLPYIAKRLESGSVSVEGNNITVRVINYGQQDAE